MPKRTDIKSILIIGAGPDRHRPGLRVRLFGHPGLQGAEGGGLPHRPGQLQSGDHHDRPGPGGRHLCRADHARNRREDHREGARRIALLPTMGGQTALNCALSLTKMGMLEQVRRRDDRRQRRGHRQGRGPRAVPRRDDEASASKRRRSASRTDARRGAGGAELHRPAGDHPPVASRMGGTGGGIAYNKDEFDQTSSSAASMPRPTDEVLIEESVLGWKEFEMEVVRDKDGQLHHRLLDREPRPDGRAHRRLHHRRPGADADRQGIPASCAMPRSRCCARSASRPAARNVQFAVNPDDGRMIVIEMNPRVSRSSALASKATGFPIAKVAAKLAVGYTLDETRQRHHRRRDAGLVRADHRLRRHQDPALRLREVPERRQPR